jgi:hypothetical protein
MSNRAWTSERIQFPRLLAEIRAVGLTSEQYADLQQSMDVSRGLIDDLLERAESVWQARKESTRLRGGSNVEV